MAGININLEFQTRLTGLQDAKAQLQGLGKTGIGSDVDVRPIMAQFVALVKEFGTYIKDAKTTIQREQQELNKTRADQKRYLAEVARTQGLSQHSLERAYLAQPTSIRGRQQQARLQQALQEAHGESEWLEQAQRGHRNISELANSVDDLRTKTSLAHKEVNTLGDSLDKMSKKVETSTKKLSQEAKQTFDGMTTLAKRAAGNIERARGDIANILSKDIVDEKALKNAEARLRRHTNNYVTIAREANAKIKKGVTPVEDVNAVRAIETAATKQQNATAQILANNAKRINSQRELDRALLQSSQVADAAAARETARNKLKTGGVSQHDYDTVARQTADLQVRQNLLRDASAQARMAGNYNQAKEYNRQANALNSPLSAQNRVLSELSGALALSRAGIYGTTSNAAIANANNVIKQFGSEKDFARRYGTLGDAVGMKASIGNMTQLVSEADQARDQLLAMWNSMSVEEQRIAQRTMDAIEQIRAKGHLDIRLEQEKHDALVTAAQTKSASKQQQNAQANKNRNDAIAQLPFLGMLREYSQGSLNLRHMSMEELRQLQDVIPAKRGQLFGLFRGADTMSPAIRDMMENELGMSGLEGGVLLNQMAREMRAEMRRRNRDGFFDRVRANLGFGDSGRVGLMGSYGMQRFSGSLGMMGNMAGVSLMSGGALYGMGHMVRSTAGSAVELESAKATIAGMLNTYLQFVDAQGESVDRAENFRRSLIQSEALYEKLRETSKDVLVTPQELAENFMTGAPKLFNAGFSQDDILHVVSRIVMMGRAMNLKSTDIQSDIRDFAMGSITTRSHVLQSFGLTKEGLQGAYAQGGSAGALAYFNQRTQGFEPTFEKLRNELPGQINALRVELESAAQRIGVHATPGIIKGIRVISDKLAEFGASGGFERIGQSFGNMVNSMADLVAKAAPIVIGASQNIYTALSTVLAGAISVAAVQAMAAANPIAALVTALGLLTITAVSASRDIADARARLEDDNVSNAMQTTSEAQRVDAVQREIGVAADKLARGDFSPNNPGAAWSAYRTDMSAVSTIRNLGRVREKSLGRGPEWDGENAMNPYEKFGVSLFTMGESQDQYIDVRNTLKAQRLGLLSPTKPINSLQKGSSSAFKASLSKMHSADLMNIAGWMGANGFWDGGDGSGKGWDAGMLVGQELTKRFGKNWAADFTGALQYIDKTKDTKGSQGVVNSRAYTEAGGANNSMVVAANKRGVVAANKVLKARGLPPIKSLSELKAYQTKYKGDQNLAVLEAGKAAGVAMQSVMYAPVVDGSNIGTEDGTAKAPSYVTQTSALDARLAALGLNSTQLERLINNTPMLAQTGPNTMTRAGLYYQGLTNSIVTAQTQYQSGVANAYAQGLGDHEISKLQSEYLSAIEHAVQAYEQQIKQLIEATEQQKLANSLLKQENDIKQQQLVISRAQFDFDKRNSQIGSYSQGQSALGSLMDIMGMRLGVAGMQGARSMSQTTGNIGIRKMLDNFGVGTYLGDQLGAVQSLLGTAPNSASVVIDSNMSALASPGGLGNVTRSMLIQMTGQVGKLVDQSCAQFVSRLGMQLGFLTKEIVNAADLEKHVQSSGDWVKVSAGEFGVGDLAFSVGSGPSGRHAMIGTGGMRGLQTNTSGGSLVRRIGGERAVEKQYSAKSGLAVYRYKGKGNGTVGGVDPEVVKGLAMAMVATMPGVGPGLFPAAVSFNQPLMDANDSMSIQGVRLDSEAAREEIYQSTINAAMSITGQMLDILGMGRIGRQNTFAMNLAGGPMLAQRIKLSEMQSNLQLLERQSGVDRGIAQYNYAQSLAQASMIGGPVGAKMARSAELEFLDTIAGIDGALEEATNAIAKFTHEIENGTRVLELQQEMQKALWGRDASKSDSMLQRMIGRIGASPFTNAGDYFTSRIGEGYTKQYEQGMFNVSQSILEQERFDRLSLLPDGSTVYDTNIRNNPQYYEQMRHEREQALRNQLMDGIKGNPNARRAFANATLAQSGSNLARGFTGLVMDGPGRLSALQNAFAPLLDIQGAFTGDAFSMALGAMSVDELTERGMGRFVKEVTDKNGVMSKVVDKAALIKYGTTQMAASLAGDLGGNLLGTTLFPDKDPAAVSMGTSLAMSGVMLGQMTGAFTGAFSWMAGPLGIVAGGLLGGLLGGLFGGRKKSPEELQLEENRKNFQKRIEDILSRIDKNLGPQADYYRSINGQVMYGSASAWFSGRAYDRMGILSTLGRR